MRSKTFPFPIETQIQSLMSKLKRHDPYTAGHCYSVARYASTIAPVFNFCPKELYLAGLLHDIGKLKTPVSILQKPGRLSDAEFDTIKLHPVQGYEILQRYKLQCLTSNIMNAVLLHHERLDGTGYPYSRRSDIPTFAKIISVIDAFDSITSHRPYRRPRSAYDALVILKDGQGTQFEPEVVSHFCAFIERKKTVFL